MLPQHVAIIMDGNGRWAKSRGMIRSFGHAEGIKSIERIANYSNKIGIKFLTLYAFSTENWNRSESEIDFLMKIFIPFDREKRKYQQRYNRSF